MSNKTDELRFDSYEKKQLTYEQRRQRALSIGTKVTYLGCPLCGLNRPIEGLTRSGRRRDEFLKDTEKLLQYRIGGGRGLGFFWTEPSDRPHYPPKDLSDLYNSSDYYEKSVFNNLKEEVLKIMDEIERIEQGTL